MSLSSLNRHAVATRADVGIPKAICLKKHFSSIFPECHVEAKVMLYDSSSEEEILSGNPDFVLDCIDNIDTKVPFLHRLELIRLFPLVLLNYSISDVWEIPLVLVIWCAMILLSHFKYNVRWDFWLHALRGVWKFCVQLVLVLELTQQESEWLI